MSLRSIPALMFVILTFHFCLAQSNYGNLEKTIARGKMPCVANDKKGNLHMVYGNGDSIMYTFSVDQGNSFSSPVLVSILPGLTAASMRGPQIASTGSSVLITACNKSGNIFSYKSIGNGRWSGAVRINDEEDAAKENFMALGADAQNCFATWLDMRNGHNQMYGTASADGGLTWSKNVKIYASPDLSVCECCKPSVIVKGSRVYVMFRNWLHGNRDLYLIQSSNNGNSFGAAKKLGTGNWALEGCPMDGGGFAINDKGEIETVWRRKDKIYSCKSGQPERLIGEGKSCTIESVNGKNIYAWTSKGNIFILKPMQKATVIGKGSLPSLKSVRNGRIVCVWENEGKIQSEMLNF